MKKSAFIILLLAVVLCSCDNGSSREPLTERGKQIRDTWNAVTNSIIQDVPAQVFYLNDWIHASDSMRPWLERNYFSGGHVLDKGDGIYEIYSAIGTMYMMVDTRGSELSQSGAVWEIHRSAGYGMQAYSFCVPAFVEERENVFYMTALGDNSWHIAMDSTTSAGSSLNLTIRVPGISMPVDIFSHRFSVEGSGLYLFSETEGNATPDIVTLQFDVQKDLVNGYSQYENSTSVHHWEAGKVSLVAKKQGRDDIDVIAEYTGNGGVSITYRGVTEQW